ncbi:MAG: hypothetical protein IME93_05040 [Proteobacteria bacterium]|nr:hypothetical protein [Pseudomonadota bacterium]
MTTSNELLIGAWGWSGEWSGSGGCSGYYSDEMPEDWQLCYYSNLHRAVLLPEEVWRKADADVVGQWLEDTDPEFVFVPAVGAVVLDEIAGGGSSDWPAMAQLQQQIGCLLAMPTARQLQQPQWLKPLRAGRALCIQLPETIAGDISSRSRALEQICQAGASVLWDTRTEPKPEACGDWLIAIADTQEASNQRTIIEQLGQWMSDDDRHAVLLFTGEQAPQAAEQARTLAELMGI